MIEQLLKEIKEDKIDNLSTTSFKFKTDIWNFFQGYDDKIAVEFGTHKGQTTRILSFLFKKVYTININDNRSAKELNSDRDNIIYIDNFDLYAGNPLPINDEISMYLIDAGHEYNQVISDINMAFSLNCSKECYIVFDDYGVEQYIESVHKAVNHAIASDALLYVVGIGHESGFSFGGTPPRILMNSEGLITKINFQ
jgi:hypothetical protein